MRGHLCGADPEVPVIADLAEWLFNGNDSPCNPLICKSRPYHRGVLQGSLLIASPAFRKQTLRMLEDKRANGYCQVGGVPSPDEKAKEKTKFPPDPHDPPSGTKIPLRVCDLYLDDCGALEGTPKCEIHWPEKERDQTGRSLFRVAAAVWPSLSPQ